MYERLMESFYTPMIAKDYHKDKNGDIALTETKYPPIWDCLAEVESKNCRSCLT